MVRRIAGIACFAVTLLCFVVGRPVTTNSFSTTVRSELNSIENNQTPCVVDQQSANTENAGSSRPSVASALSPVQPTSGRLRSSLNPVVLSGASAIATPESIQLVTFTSEGDGLDPEPASRFLPKAGALQGQIKTLQQIPLANRWATETMAILDAIARSATDSENLTRYFAQLEQQIQTLPQLAQAVRRSGSDSVESNWQQSEISRASYRLRRRLDVWQAFQLTNSNEAKPRSMNQVGFNRISFNQLDARWIEYLKLNEYRDTFECLNPDPEKQKKVAREILARVYSPVLKPQQSAYVLQAMDPEIIEYLKVHARDPVDASELMKRIELYESRSSALSGYYLNDQFQNLLWSNSPADQAVAHAVQTHYRNANFRFVVSEQLLNRLVPELPTTAMPVSENIKGAHVSGQSQISNQLRVQLIPDPNQIMLQLATQGRVHSDTIARTNAFRIQNQGNARFQVVKRIAIGREGIDASERPQALSSANQTVVGIQSKLDDVPVLGWMARKLAVKKLREQAPETDRIFQRKVSNSAETKMQQQVDEQVAKLRQYVYTKLFQPLLAMELEPVPMQMATTDTQVVMRYRLAGADQMAANTARPRDSGKSLLSFQLHQSAINNMIARIGLNDNLFTIEELSNHLRDVVGAPQVALDESTSEQHAEIGFAHFDPIRIDFEEDRMDVTLNLKSLKIGENGKQWKNISLTAAYKLNVEGITLRLDQDDDGTRIKGKRLRFGDKAAISTVMKVLFKQQYTTDALPGKVKNRIGAQQLEVSQLVVSDGWIAISIDDRIQATRPVQPDNERMGAFRRLINPSNSRR